MKAKRSVCKAAAAAVLGFMLTACAGKSLDGKWVEPIPGMEGQVQGVCLEKGGKARSVNSATLLYEKWEQKGDTLILSGKSLGNGVIIDFSDSYVIEKLSDDELVLKNEDLTIKYHKQTEE